jgi:polyhydroxyalkanoate synthesis repressor PhaR
MPSTRRAEAADAVEPGAAAGATRVLKKYPNRRLYDTRTSSYITLADVKRMVLGNEAFEVRDAKTGEELTRSILLQIILEEESGGVPIFSTETLAQLIRFYGHAMQGVMGAYLEKNLQTFAEMQSRLLAYGKATPPAFTPEAWAQMMGGQSPLVQNMFTNYVEQSRELMTRLQEQMARQAETMVPPAVPGFGPPKR